MLLRDYRSRVDGSVQPYAVSVSPGVTIRRHSRDRARLTACREPAYGGQRIEVTAVTLLLANREPRLPLE